MTFCARIARCVQLDKEERRSVLSLERQPATIFRPGESLFRSGEPVRRAWLLSRGWAAWQEMLADGSCQVLDFALPGDTPGLLSTLLTLRLQTAFGVAGNDPLSLQVAAVTEVQAVSLDAEALESLFRAHPRLEGPIMAFAAVDTLVALRRHLANAGRRHARERLANLFVELWERQQAHGPSPKRNFVLPVSQTMLADALGITSVHVSRVLTQLAGDGVLSFHKQSRVVVVRDPVRLYEIAGISKSASQA